LIPFAVVQGHELLDDEPGQHVALILHAHTRAIGAAAGDQDVAGLAERSLEITMERYGDEAVEGILGGVRPIQPHPERWNFGLRNHKTRSHVPEVHNNWNDDSCDLCIWSQHRQENTEECDGGCIFTSQKPKLEEVLDRICGYST